MTSPIPDPTEQATHNAALLHTGTETGFWDDHGRPAPWPDDIDECEPVTDPPSHEPGQQPF
jgi:hypothetical protein